MPDSRLQLTPDVAAEVEVALATGDFKMEFGGQAVPPNSFTHVFECPDRLRQLTVFDEGLMLDLTDGRLNTEIANGAWTAGTAGSNMLI